MPTPEALEPRADNAIVKPTSSPMDMLATAIANGLPIETITQLVALNNQQEDRNALREFNAAKAAFQRECPPVHKNKTANIATRSGAKFGYSFSSLDEIQRTVSPFLHKNGFSFRWTNAVNGGVIEVNCILVHSNGHSETSTFTCAIDTAAGMSEQQKVAAALSFARRQSLVQVLGLTSCDDDTDAAEHPQPPDGSPAPTSSTIDESQVSALKEMILEADADLVRFCGFFGIETIDQLLASRFKEAKSLLELKATTKKAQP